MRNLNRLIIFALFATSCKSKLHDDGKTFHTSYVVQSIPDMDSFNKMNQEELDFEKEVTRLEDSLKIDPRFKIRESSYQYNRCRLFVDSDRDNRIFPVEIESDKSLALPCDCFVSRDTLFVELLPDLFQIRIFDNRFNSRFFIHGRYSKLYKSSLSDTAFKEEAEATSKYQYLVLDRAPTFKTGQQLTGYFTMTSNRFYKLISNDHVDSTFVAARFVFTCHTFVKHIH